MRFWLDKGVDGFRVDAVYRLFEDKQLRHETRSDNRNAQAGDYKSLVHNLTRNQPETYDMVAQWRELLDEYSKKDGNTRLENDVCMQGFWFS
jgi:alpha-glucosidase